MIATEQDLPADRMLPSDAEYRVVAFYRECLEDKTIAHGKHGQMAFADAVLDNTHFLPPDVQSDIDKLRGDMSQRDFLLAHPEIGNFLCPYLGDSACEKETTEI